MDTQQIADAYLRYYGTKQEVDKWATGEVDKLIRRDADTGWEITRAILEKTESNAVLAYVAAGPLEDLINHHGHAVMARIEEECLTNDRLRLALSGVWIERENPVWERWYD